MFRSSLYKTDRQKSISDALKWIKDYEANKTPSTAFVEISVPSGIGKGAKSYVLQLNGGASYILKISKQDKKYNDTNFKSHLKRLFTVVGAMNDKEAILSPIYATVQDARLCLIYVPCKAVKRKDVAVTCGEHRDTSIARKLFKAVQHLHQNGFVGFDIKADNLLSCAGSYGLTDYENCISNGYHKTLPDLSGNFNVLWKDANGKTIDRTNVKKDFETYKVYYMALDYIALFSMLGSYTFSLGSSIYVTSFKIEEQEKNIKKKKRINSCQRQLLQNIITLLRFPERASQYAEKRWTSLFPLKF
tara:strand:+ start:247 stop:1155 length:909 start_codon:yes stop_codon:yes gene_type:complete